MKILLVGRDGQVAWELRRSLACLGEVIAVDRRSQPLRIDLEDADSIREAVQVVRPDLIVNAAAYTAVDQAEQESERAHRINAEAPGILAQAAADVHAGVIHYSTDYVFSGDADRPYSEDAATDPQGVYGASKRLGEGAIEAAAVPYLILRTAWVYGARGHNFLLTMLRLMDKRDALNVVDDQVGAPTWSRQIAECTALMIAQCRRDGRFEPRDRSGIYHITCAGLTSWYGFAEQIRDRARAVRLLSEGSAALHAIPSKDYPTPAKRPAYSVLSNEKVLGRFGLRMPAWDEALGLCLTEYAGCRGAG